MITAAETASGALHNMSAPPRMRLTVRPLHPPEGPAAAAGITALGILDLKVFGGYSSPLAGLARLALTVSGREPPEDLDRLPDEDLGDVIVRQAARLDPPSLGLPPFAVLRPTGETPADPPIDDPAVAVALLTRLSGRLFIARRSPHVPDIAKITRPMAVHTMERR